MAPPWKTATRERTLPIPDGNYAEVRAFVLRVWSAATIAGVFYGLKAVLAGHTEHRRHNAMAYANAARNLLTGPAEQELSPRRPA